MPDAKKSSEQVMRFLMLQQLAPRLRFGFPEEFADAVCHLVCDGGAYTNGEVVRLDAGLRQVQWPTGVQPTRAGVLDKLSRRAVGDSVVADTDPVLRDTDPVAPAPPTSSQSSSPLKEWHYTVTVTNNQLSVFAIINM